MRLILTVALGLPGAALAEVEIPKCVDPKVKVSLVAQHPDVVTPTGIAVDRKGRIFVLENHTHFRPGDYDGPQRDRILLFDGGEKPKVFYEGLTFGTDLLFDSMGNLYATTRAEVVVFRRAADHEKAPKEPDLLVELLTPCQYPHDGVSGLAFPKDEKKLYFGFGENLGEKYTFVGADGTRISGGGEGGSIYRCDPNGFKLERIATGFWNPYGMVFDPAGNLFAAGNDPGSSPPCRLMHIVDGADYGFEFRYGRSGLHPFHSWHGDKPGTLPMADATGEAPCGIITLGRDLLVASWADHRIDRHVLFPRGASFGAKREPFIKGGNDFRPVHLSWARDRKTLYVTDWVNASYFLHKQGRVWKFEFPEAVPEPEFEKPTAEADMAALLREGGASFDECVAALAGDDPFIRNAAIYGLRKYPEKLAGFEWDKSKSARQRANFGIALKLHGGESARTQIPGLLNDPSSEVRFVGVKWVADDMLKNRRKAVAKLLEAPGLDQKEFLVVMAALDRLDGTKKVRDVPDPAKLLGVLANKETPSNLRALALRMIPADHTKLPVKRLTNLLGEKDPELQLEAVLSLQHHPDEEGSRKALETIAENWNLSSRLRAEAIVGLVRFLPAEWKDGEKLTGTLRVVAELQHSTDSVVAAEAERALSTLTIDGNPPRANMHVTYPDQGDIDAWMKKFGDVDQFSEADAEVGRRLFFHPRLGTCYQCHQVHGRGIRVGPDLSTVHERGDMRWLLESILQPNKEIAPQFLPWSIATDDGKTYTGLPLRKGGTKETYLGIDGKEFSLKKDTITSHQEMQISLMPMGLLPRLANDEIRELLAYLMQPPGD